MPDLASAILDKLEREHRGVEHPLTLDRLMAHLLEIGRIKEVDKDEERRVRSVIAENIDICNAGEGYYLARKVGHREDIEETIRYLKRTYRDPIDQKIDKKKEAFPQYYPKFDSRQGELF